MASTVIKKAILKHLSATTDSWASVVAKVVGEIGVGPMFVNAAMRQLAEDGEIQPVDDGSKVPTYTAPGPGEGKYRPIGERRLDSERKKSDSKDPWGPNPWSQSINGPKAV